MKFKVGDKVRLKMCDFAGLRVGQVGIVTDVKNHKEFSVNGCDGCYIEYWDLVESADSELEELVRKANEIPALLHKLKQHADVNSVFFGFSPTSTTVKLLELVTKHIPSMLCDPSDKPFHIIKPKFEPFTVGRNWLVKLEGENLQVGCQTFKAAKLLSCLKDLISNEAGVVYPGTNEGIHAGRTLKFKGNSLSWEDAEKIVAALEKAGVN